MRRNSDIRKRMNTCPISAKQQSMFFLFMLSQTACSHLRNQDRISNTQLGEGQVRLAGSVNTQEATAGRVGVIHRTSGIAECRLPAACEFQTARRSTTYSFDSKLVTRWLVCIASLATFCDRSRVDSLAMIKLLIASRIS